MPLSDFCTEAITSLLLVFFVFSPGDDHHDDGVDYEGDDGDDYEGDDDADDLLCKGHHKSPDQDEHDNEEEKEC